MISSDQTINHGRRGTGRVWGYRISRRGVAARRHRESGQEDRRGDPERAARRGDRGARRGRALRADSRARGLPQRALHREARRRRGRGRAESPEAQGRHLTDRRHRTVPETRDIGRGGHRRDAPAGVSTRRSRTCPRPSEAHRCPPAPSPTSTRRPSWPSRGGAGSRSTAGAPTSSSTASTSNAAGEGRTGTSPPRRHRRELLRRPRSNRPPRGLHRVRRLVARVLFPAQGARPLGRPPGHRGQVRGHVRRPRGGVPGGPLPALHRALLPKRAGKGPGDEEEGGRRDAQGGPRAGGRAGRAPARRWKSRRSSRG